MKNRIINGDMRIDQRNAGASYTQVNGAFNLDRWDGNSFDGGAAASKYSVQQSSTAPTGFSKSLLVTSLANTASNVSNIFNIEQRIEGFNFADFMYGTANAQTLTLSFWVRSSLTGTFGGALKNEARNRAYPFTYTITTANTWEYETITIPGDQSGTWIGATNGTGLWLSFGLGVGTSYTEPAGSWVGGDQFSADGCVSVIGTSGATWYITGVQVEKGSTATAFDTRSYGTELHLCQRYCHVWSSLGLSYCWLGVGYTTTNYGQAHYKYPQIMRAVPSATFSEQNKWIIDIPTGNATSTAISVAWGNLEGLRLQVNVASGITSGQPCAIGNNGDAGTRTVIFSAEL